MIYFDENGKYSCPEQRKIAQVTENLRGHCRLRTPPPRLTQLPAIRRRHRPRVSVHDRSAIRRDRTIAHLPPRLTQLPAIRRRHRPHASVHDRTDTRFDCITPSRHATRTPGGRALRSHHRGRLGLLCAVRTAVAPHGLELPRNSSSRGAGGPADLARGACANPAGHAGPTLSMVQRTVASGPCVRSPC